MKAIDEWRQLLQAEAAEFEKLKADNARLRALLKEVEFDLSLNCPWCHIWEGEQHLSDCPAFTPAGEVK